MNKNISDTDKRLINDNSQQEILSQFNETDIKSVEKEYMKKEIVIGDETKIFLATTTTVTTAAVGSEDVKTKNEEEGYLFFHFENKIYLFIPKFEKICNENSLL